MALVPSLAVCSPDGRTVPWAQYCCSKGPARNLMCFGPALSSKPVLQKPLPLDNLWLTGVGRVQPGL